MTTGTGHGSIPRFTLPTFEGPLDLLLQLIRENEVDIRDIPIAEITRQYMERLAEWQSLDLTMAGEYLVMAATLLEIKSRMLLPQAPRDEDEPDPRAELVERLLEYQRFVSVVDQLREWERYRASLYFRHALEEADDYILPVEAGEVSGKELALVFQRVLEQAGVRQEDPVSAIVPQQRISLKMKMAEIMRAVRRSPNGISFAELIESCEGLTEVVLAFLAMLELLRTGRLRVVQRRPLATIRIYPATESEAEEGGTMDGETVGSTA